MTVSVREVSLDIKGKSAKFIARKIESVFNEKPEYEFFVVIHGKGGVRSIFPKRLTTEQLAMSVDEYKNTGRDEWFNYVSLSQYVEALGALNGCDC